MIFPTSLYLLVIPMLDLKVTLPVNIFRVLKYLDKHNYKALQAKVTETNLKPVPLLNLNSGYITRVANMLSVRK
jgi:hypothetical protein